MIRLERRNFSRVMRVGVWEWGLLTPVFDLETFEVLEPFQIESNKHQSVDRSYSGNLAICKRRRLPYTSETRSFSCVPLGLAFTVRQDRYQWKEDVPKIAFHPKPPF